MTRKEIAINELKEAKMNATEIRDAEPSGVQKMGWQEVAESIDSILDFISHHRLANG